MPQVPLHHSLVAEAVPHEQDRTGQVKAMFKDTLKKAPQHNAVDLYNAFMFLSTGDFIPDGALHQMSTHTIFSKLLNDHD